MSEVKDFLQAAHLGQKEQIIKMIDSGMVEVNAMPFGDTALHCAARSGHGEVVRILLDRGADINLANSAHKNTAYHLAALGGHNDVLKELNKYTAAHGEVSESINSQNRFGNTPAILAASQGFSKTVSYLESKGADMSIANNLGDTAASVTKDRAPVKVQTEAAISR